MGRPFFAIVRGPVLRFCKKNHFFFLKIWFDVKIMLIFTTVNETQKQLEMANQDSQKTQMLLAKIQKMKVPTAILEHMKSDSIKYYNNETDAMLTNPHFKRSTLALISRGMDVLQYTDGINTLFFIKSKTNPVPKHWNGTSILNA